MRPLCVSPSMLLLLFALFLPVAAGAESSGWPQPSESVPVVPDAATGLNIPRAVELPLESRNWRKLMRPSGGYTGEWQPETSGVSRVAHEAKISMPTFPIFGPPPPIFDLRYEFTRLDAIPSLDVPGELHQTTFGFAWMRRFNERWMARFMGGATFATDGENESSDAWRFRGGAFAIYQPSSRWSWTFGAMALGRNDLPVVPAIGVIYQPHERVRYDAIMPRPRVSLLLRDLGERQHWGYLGLGLAGTTWGVQRRDGTDDQLTYGDWRATIGWESSPRAQPGIPFTRGRKFGFELGYAFSRDFEWEAADETYPLGDSLLLRSWLNF